MGAANPPKSATKQSGPFLATQEVGCGLKLFCPEPETAITAQRPRMFSLFGGVGVEARRKKRRISRDAPAILVARPPPSLLAPFSGFRGSFSLSDPQGKLLAGDLRAPQKGNEGQREGSSEGTGPQVAILNESHAHTFLYL